MWMVRELWTNYKTVQIYGHFSRITDGAVKSTSTVHVWSRFYTVYNDRKVLRPCMCGRGSIQCTMIEKYFDRACVVAVLYSVQ